MLKIKLHRIECCACAYDELINLVGDKHKSYTKDMVMIELVNEVTTTAKLKV